MATHPIEGNDNCISIWVVLKPHERSEVLLLSSRTVFNGWCLVSSRLVTFPATKQLQTIEIKMAIAIVVLVVYSGLPMSAMNPHYFQNSKYIIMSRINSLVERSLIMQPETITEEYTQLTGKHFCVCRSALTCKIKFWLVMYCLQHLILM